MSTDVLEDHIAFKQETGVKLVVNLMLVSSLAYSSTYNMEEKCSPETSVDFQRTAGRCIPEDEVHLTSLKY
jgi:hypothetical protein